MADFIALRTAIEWSSNFEFHPKANLSGGLWKNELSYG